ncbi:MAG: chemotaxis sensory transducer, partial [Herbinix sp.]|nr:chemotaxis sensory transducer [Herbinix sp.]
MRWFYNMKIGAKLVSSFILVALIAGIVGVIGIVNIRTLDDNDYELYEKITVPIAEAGEMSRLFQEVRVINRDMILKEKVEDINGLYQEIKDHIVQLNTVCDSFNENIISDRMQEAFDHFLATREVYREHLETFLALTLENKDEEAYLLLENEMKVSADNEQGAINNLVNLKVEDADEKALANKATATKAIYMMLIVV